MDERITGRKPQALSFADAAALPLTVITAWETLFDRLGLGEGSTGILLVVGATDGVGSVMLALAEALPPNVTVIATASDDERAAWVQGLGAEHVVNHRDDLTTQVCAVASDGVDRLFTALSEGQVETYAQIVRPFGHIVAIDDGTRDVSPLKGKSIDWHRELMFTRPLQRTLDMIEQHRPLNTVADLVNQGRIRTTTTALLETPCGSGGPQGPGHAGESPRRRILTHPARPRPSRLTSIGASRRDRVRRRDPC